MNVVQRAEFERMRAALPKARESHEPASFTPGVICFRDGHYCAVSPDVAGVWLCLAWWIDCLLGLLPMRHRVEYWRERIDRGATLATWFVGDDFGTDGAGIVNCEIDDDGRRIVFAGVLTFRQIDLTELSKICEAIALTAGAERVCLWTPQTVPIVTGYHVEACWFGQLQVVAVEPIQ